jgi:hypothetical protein
MPEGKKSSTGLRRLLVVAGIHPVPMMLHVMCICNIHIHEIAEVFHG